MARYATRRFQSSTSARYARIVLAISAVGQQITVTTVKSVDIRPASVTKPYQLLAAWLSGLILIDSIFIGAATYLGANTWLSAALVIASIINVPVFIGSVFLLQTRFRREMQDDDHYFRSTQNALGQEVEEHNGHTRVKPRKHDALIDESDGGILPYTIAINDHLPNFREVDSSLESLGMRPVSVFGKSRGSQVPERWVISINEDMPKALIQKVLDALAPFQDSFDGFVLSEMDREAGETEDVYIGAYGDDSLRAETLYRLDADIRAIRTVAQQGV